MNLLAEITCQTPDVFNLSPNMHFKTVLAPVALAAIVGASNERDIEPCARVSKFVADANENQCTLLE